LSNLFLLQRTDLPRARSSTIFEKEEVTPAFTSFHTWYWG